MDADSVDVLVLNYNGSGLLAECLPSLVRAVEASRHACRVIVVDNDSTDDSLKLLARDFPSVAVVRQPNRGLCSFNEVLRASTCRVALLLNNDVRCEPDALDPLIDAVLAAPTTGEEPSFAAAPRCYLLDGTTHEGFQTAVTWRFGLVSATALFPGAEHLADRPGPTASAGAVLAVDREKFLTLGGFDPLFLPGRIEDLDFCYRGFQAGFQARYVPASVFYHRGGATFDAAFSRRGSERLALRNTLLFQWKNLRLPWHSARQVIGLSLRAVRDVVRAPFVSANEQFAFLRTYVEARQLWRERGPQSSPNLEREREFFHRHSPQRLSATAHEAWHDSEVRRDAEFPISRRVWRPWGRAAAVRLASLGVRPTHITIVGVVFAIAAATSLGLWPTASWGAAILFAAAWLCDRIDGPLARLQRSTTPLGAWIDANVDECVDLGLHVATAATASRLMSSPWPWFWLVGFLIGKYLLMHGLSTDDGVVGLEEKRDRLATPRSLLRSLYHLPASADVRAHLLIAALATGWLTAELAFLAIYYNLRWAARFVLLARRAAAARSAEVAA